MNVLVYCTYCQAMWVARGDDAAAAWPRYGQGPFQKRFWGDPVPVMICPRHRLALARGQRELVGASRR